MSSNVDSGAKAPARTGPHDMRRIALASVIGTTIEYYDLFIFATASALIFNKTFFPSFDPLVGTMLAFMTFASAYLARIIGAIVFGHFGDRVGRKSMLLTSLLMMGVATCLIGVLPDYSTIGVAAPLLLVALRMVQGLALGGEWGGAVLMAVEHSPRGRQYFFGSLVQIGVPVGTLLANLAFLVVAFRMPEEALVSWGWRIPFLASAVLIVIGLWIRLRVQETPSFRALSDDGQRTKMPFAVLVRRHWGKVLLGALATLSTGVFNILVAIAPAYGKNTLGYSTGDMLIPVVVACVVGLLTIPLFGRLADRAGGTRVIVVGVAAQIVLVFPLFWLMQTQSVILMSIGYAMMMLAFSANFGPLAALLAGLFDASVRYSGLSVAYMLSGLLGTAVMTLVTTGLLAYTGHVTAVAWYVIGSAVVAVLALWGLTLRRPRGATKNQFTTKG